jgi:hypothetical protein
VRERQRQRESRKRKRQREVKIEIGGERIPKFAIKVTIYCFLKKHTRAVVAIVHN